MISIPLNIMATGTQITNFDSLYTAAHFNGTLASSSTPWAKSCANVDISTIADLIGGLVLSGAGIFGMKDSGSSWGGHVSSLGHGMLAAYATKLGMSLGGPAANPAPKGLGYGQPAFASQANESAWSRR